MNSIKYLHALVFLIHATSTLLINTLFSFLKERANTWLLHQKSEDFSVGHFKFFCSTGVQSYNGKPIFQQSKFDSSGLLVNFYNAASWKEYFPNLLESTLLVKIFVFWVRDLKFWLLAYFFILLSCAKFQQDWTTLILDIL